MACKTKVFAGGVSGRKISPDAPVGLFGPFAGQTNAGAAMHVGRHHLVGQVMHDPVDIRRRIDRLTARVDRRDDYGRLLADGQVIHAVDDVQDVEA